MSVAVARDAQRDLAPVGDQYFSQHRRALPPRARPRRRSSRPGRTRAGPSARAQGRAGRALYSSRFRGREDRQPVRGLAQHGVGSASPRPGPRRARARASRACRRPRSAARACGRAGSRGRSASGAARARPAPDRRDQRARGRIHRLGEPRAVGKPRRGVAVVAHAEHDEIGRHRQPRDARAAPRRVPAPASARESASGTNFASAARLRSSVSRTSRALERGLSSGTQRSSASVTATRDQSIARVDSAWK